MSSKTQEIFKPIYVALYLVTMLAILCFSEASLAASTCYAAYFPSVKHLIFSKGHTKKQAIRELERNIVDLSVSEINASSLKDLVSIRAESARLNCPAVFSFQTSNAIDSSYITVVLLETMTGKILDESALSSKSRAQFLYELSRWAQTIQNKTLKPEAVNLKLFGKQLAALKRCEDAQRFLPREDYKKICDEQSSVIHSRGAKDPIKIQFKNLIPSLKHAWVRQIQDSQFFMDSQKLLTKTADLWIECSQDACKSGFIRLTIFTTPAFLENVENKSSALRRLFSQFLEVQEAVAKETKTTLFNVSAVLHDQEDRTLDIKIKGHSKDLRLKSQESIDEFLNRY